MQPAVRIEQDEAERRAHGPRTAVGHVTTVRSQGGHPQDVVVLDLSARGLLYQAASALPIGTAITVGLAGAGSAEATIVRRDGDRHGAAFNRPLTAQQLADAIVHDVVVRPLFTDAAIPLPTVVKWPRPVRGLVAIASAGAGWGAVAAMGFVISRALN